MLQFYYIFQFQFRRNGRNGIDFFTIPAPKTKKFGSGKVEAGLTSKPYEKNNSAKRDAPIRKYRKIGVQRNQSKRNARALYVRSEDSSCTPKKVMSVK